jgi:hypothetical protein
MAVNDAEIKAFVDQNIKSPAVISQAAIDLDISVEDIARATGYSPNNVIDYFLNAGVRVPRTTSIAASRSRDELVELDKLFIKNSVNDPAVPVVQAYNAATSQGIYFANDLARITGLNVRQVRDYFSNAGFPPPPFRTVGVTDAEKELIAESTPTPARSNGGYISFLNNLATLEFLRTKPASITNVFDWTEGKRAFDAYLVSLGQPPFFNLPDGVNPYLAGTSFAVLWAAGYREDESGNWFKPPSGNGGGGDGGGGSGRKIILRLPPQDPLRPGRTKNASGQVLSPGLDAGLSYEQIKSNIERRLGGGQLTDYQRYGINFDYFANGAYQLQLRALSNPDRVLDVNVRYEYIPNERDRENGIVLWSLYDFEHVIIGPDIDRAAVAAAALESGISNAELAGVLGIPENQVPAYIQGLAPGPSSDLKNPASKFLQVIKPSAGAF